MSRLATKYPGAIVVSGGAKGVDTCAEVGACGAGLSVISFRPYRYEAMSREDEFSIEVVTIGEAAQAYVVERHLRISPPWRKTHAGICFVRNTWIVEHAERVIAFWDGKSSGTRHTIEIARSKRRPLYVYDEYGVLMGVGTSLAEGRIEANAACTRPSLVRTTEE